MLDSHPEGVSMDLGTFHALSSVWFGPGGGRKDSDICNEQADEA